MPEHSTDYHDYVFKNGACIGAFDEMYTYAENIPWHQDTAAFTDVYQAGIAMIRSHVDKSKKPFDTICEIGCGLGYYISQFAPFATTLHGSDISEAAIEKAKSLHTGIDFFAFDMTHTVPQEMMGNYELVIMPEIMWYVLPHLECVKNNVSLLLRPGGHFLFKQSFPYLDKPFVGKEQFSEPDAFIRFWNTFTILDSSIIDLSAKDEGIHLTLFGRKQS